jgi:hypothetical protein
MRRQRRARWKSASGRYDASAESISHLLILYQTQSRLTEADNTVHGCDGPGR